MPTNQSHHSIEKSFKPFQHSITKAKLITEFKKRYALEKRILEVKQTIADTEKTILLIEISLRQKRQEQKRVGDNHPLILKKRQLDVLTLARELTELNTQLVKAKTLHQSLNQRLGKLSTKH